MIKSAFVSLPPLASIGIGLLLFYLGLKLLGVGLKGVANTDLLRPIDNPYIMFFVAIGVTLLWQSSSLTTALLVPLVISGQIGLVTALAGALGSNIGTTGTAWLSWWFSDGANVGAGRSVAIFHSVINLAMAFIFLNPFMLRLSARLLNMVS